MNEKQKAIKYYYENRKGYENKCGYPGLLSACPFLKKVDIDRIDKYSLIVKCELNLFYEFNINRYLTFEKLYNQYKIKDFNT